MHTSSICDTKPAISLKRSSLEPNLVKGVYRNSCTAYRLVTNLATGRQHCSPTDISHNFCRSATKYGSVRGLASRKLFPEFRELWSQGPVTPCGDTRQFFTDALVKWFFDNFPMSADSFSVLSIFTALPEDYVQAFYTSAPHRAVVPCDSTA